MQLHDCVLGAPILPGYSRLSCAIPANRKSTRTTQSNSINIRRGSRYQVAVRRQPSDLVICQAAALSSDAAVLPSRDERVEAPSTRGEQRAPGSHQPGMSPPTDLRAGSSKSAHQDAATARQAGEASTSGRSSSGIKSSGITLKEEAVRDRRAVADKLIGVFADKAPPEWRKLIAFSKQWPMLADRSAAFSAGVLNACLG